MSIPLMKVLDWTEMSGIPLLSLVVSVGSLIVSMCM